MFRNNRKTSYVALCISVISVFLYHIPFYTFVIKNTVSSGFSRLFLMFSLGVILVLANFLAFYLLVSISRLLGKLLLFLFFMLNALSVYFIHTYQIIIDESMIGNILNTKFEESSSFFSFKLLLYLLFLGLLPGIVLLKTKLQKETLKAVIGKSSLALGVILLLVVSNANQVLWLDNNSKQLGGLVMPWSYTVNTALFYIHQAQKNKKEILLPDATIKDQEKTIVVLVIGESARRQNFSLYGYEKNTNPLLSQTANVFHFEANSTATYTTAGVKSILEHKESDDLYEILPNYLYRNQVDVIWKTTNWGEPPVHIQNYQSKEQLRQNCSNGNCAYDEVLLTGIKEEILGSSKNKIFLVLHMSTSHGPTYHTKYPPQFERFSPVCTSVELAQCTSEELINAYDNTLVYTDYILHRVIEDLKELTAFKSTLLFVSDHGESLGEHGVYMHGLPLRIAPKEQYEIPFIVWLSEGSRKLKSNKTLSQHHVFHSVLNFLSIESPIYKEELNIFE